MTGARPRFERERRLLGDDVNRGPRPFRVLAKDLSASLTAVLCVAGRRAGVGVAVREAAS